MKALVRLLIACSCAVLAGGCAFFDLRSQSVSQRVEMHAGSAFNLTLKVKSPEIPLGVPVGLVPLELEGNQAFLTENQLSVSGKSNPMQIQLVNDEMNCYWVDANPRELWKCNGDERPTMTPGSEAILRECPMGGGNVNFIGHTDGGNCVYLILVEVRSKPKGEVSFTDIKHDQLYVLIDEPGAKPSGVIVGGPDIVISLPPAGIPPQPGSSGSGSESMARPPAIRAGRL